MKSEAADHKFSDIVEGSSKVHRYQITEDVYAAFLKAFDDRSPIHVDSDFARSQGFTNKVMHGAILNGFVSHFVGMVFPGKPSLLLSVDLRYAQPNYLNDEIELQATVSQKQESAKIIVLIFELKNLTQNYLSARGKAQVKVNDL